MIDLSNIRSLSDFQRNTKAHVRRLKKTGKPEVLTINGPSLVSHNDVTDRQPVYHSFANAPDPVVRLERGPWTGAAAKFSYDFKAHSVTVLKMRAK